MDMKYVELGFTIFFICLILAILGWIALQFFLKAKVETLKVMAEGKRILKGLGGEKKEKIIHMNKDEEEIYDVRNIFKK